jgi:hypothetical protein
MAFRDVGVTSILVGKNQLIEIEIPVPTGCGPCPRIIRIIVVVVGDDGLPLKAWDLQDEVDESFDGIGVGCGMARPLGIGLDDDDIRFVYRFLNPAHHLYRMGNFVLRGPVSLGEIDMGSIV